VGAFQGQLSAFQGWELGREALKAINIPTHQPEEVILGNVLSAGQGQAPARQATCTAFGVDTIPATAVNKVCGSGMQALAFAFNKLALGQRNVMAAGGFESMTNAPYLLPKGRSGYRMGHGVTYDHMLHDGLEDAYHIADNGSRRGMGTFADATAEKYGFSRADQEAFALETFRYYQKAESDNLFSAERAAIVTTDAKGNSTTINTDEPPTRVKPEKFAQLKPAFGKNGTGMFTVLCRCSGSVSVRSFQTRTVPQRYCWCFVWNTVVSTSISIALVSHNCVLHSHRGDVQRHRRRRQRPSSLQRSRPQRGNAPGSHPGVLVVRARARVVHDRASGGHQGVAEAAELDG
jgi:acetyl-CoA acetyltransferase